MQFREPKRSRKEMRTRAKMREMWTPKQPILNAISRAKEVRKRDIWKFEQKSVFWVTLILDLKPHEYLSRKGVKSCLRTIQQKTSIKFGQSTTRISFPLFKKKEKRRLFGKSVIFAKCVFFIRTYDAGFSTSKNAFPPGKKKRIFRHFLFPCGTSPLKAKKKGN